MTYISPVLVHLVLADAPQCNANPKNLNTSTIYNNAIALYMSEQSHDHFVDRDRHFVAWPHLLLRGATLCVSSTFYPPLGHPMTQADSPG